MKIKRKWRKRELDKKLIAVLWFLLKFNLLAIPMYIVMYAQPSLPMLQSFVASSVNAVLNLIGYNSILEGYVVKFSTSSATKLSIVEAEMNFDCTGWKSVYALFALTLATSAMWKKKLKFLAIALPTIFVVNIFRIVTTIAATISFGLAYLELVHNLLWQEGLILTVIAIWYLWLRRENLL